MSNLSDIGFPVRSEQDVNDMISMVLEKQMVEQISCSNGYYYVASDDSGAQIYLQGNLGQELIGFNPHYDGKSRRLAALTKPIERDSSELDGGFHAWANPSRINEPESGEYRFVFDVPDFRTNSHENFPRIATIQLTAFASNDFKIYASEADYYNSQESEPYFAAKSFVPSGLFMPNEPATPIEPPRPIGIFAGEIKEYELKQNQMTSANFYWFLVETLGGEVDVVADPRLISAEPKIGGVIQGQFWLSGRMVE